MKKLFFIPFISLLTFSSGSTSEKTLTTELFEKARKAVKSGDLAANDIVGIDTAENLVAARYEAPLPTDKSPILQNLLTQLVSYFPKVPSEMKNMSGPLTWQEYRLGVEALINWKTPQDTVIKVGYFGGIPSKGPVRLDDNGFEDKFVFVRQGFVPEPQGIMGKLVILLCLAYDIAPYGFPLKFDGIRSDAFSADTTGFIHHDRGHHGIVYRGDFKRAWVLRGGLRGLLHQLPFTRELVYYIFDTVWENDLTLYLRPSGYISFGKNYAEKKIYPYLPDIYISFHGSNPFETKEALQEGIVSFMGGGPSWAKLSVAFKHINSHDQVEAILKHQEEPKSVLLKKMKKWGLVYDREKFSDRVSHASYFTDLVIFLDQQGEGIWQLLDQAFNDKRLTPKPDANPYELMEMLGKFIKEHQTSEDMEQDLEEVD